VLAIAGSGLARESIGRVSEDLAKTFERRGVEPPDRAHGPPTRLLIELLLVVLAPTLRVAACPTLFLLRPLADATKRMRSAGARAIRLVRARKLPAGTLTGVWSLRFEGELLPSRARMVVSAS